MSGFTTTPNYAFKKPITGGDVDVWGDHWNQNADSLDSLIKTINDSLPGYLRLTGGTLTGALNGPSFNATGSGYSMAGAQFLKATNTLNGATMLGINAGAAAVAAGSSAVWLTAVGWGAAQFTDPTLENTALGTKAMNALLPGGGANTALGVAALMLDGAAQNCTAVGNDAMRNTEGAQNCTIMGVYAGGMGSPKGNVAIGSSAIKGNSLSVIVGGTATAGDVLQLTFTGGFTGSPRAVSYTVVGGDTTTSIANGLVNKINTDSVFLAVPGRFVANVNLPANNCFGVQFDGTTTLGIAVTATANITGAATETVTFGGGNVGQFNTSVGYAALFGQTLTNGGNNVAVGYLPLAALTSGSGNIAIGRQAGGGITSGGSNIAIGDLAMASGAAGSNNIAIGANAASANDTGFNNVIIGVSAAIAATGANFKNNVVVGANAGRGITTGGGNTLIGVAVTAGSQNQITTGTNNIAIGSSVAVPSPTATGQLSIANAIYGAALNGTDATISDGRIGIFYRVPTATITIGDTPTNGAHIAVIVGTHPTVSGGTLDAQANDICGTATGGATSTGMTITFAKAFPLPIPKCLVTARDGLTFTYTVSQAAITIAHASASGRIFDYMVIQ